MSVAAVFFDMDGVLVDSVAHKHEHRRRLVEEELGLDVDASELVGLNVDDKYDYLRREADVGIDREEFARRADDDFDSVYVEDVSLMDEFRRLAGDLRDRGVHVGVVTASTERRLGIVVDRFDLDGLLDVAVSADAIDGPSKPEPDLYLSAASRLGVDPERCVAVEDSTNGATAATRAGMYTFGYCPSTPPEQDLSVADETVDSAGELRTRLLDRVTGDAAAER